MNTIKAIVLSQPYATWVAMGIKLIETRTWRTNHRGPLLICAGQRDHEIMGILAGIQNLPGLDLSRQLVDALAGAHARAQAGMGYPRGVAIAIVNMTDCRYMTPADELSALCPWEAGRYSWEIPSVMQIPNFRVKGQLSIFSLPVPEDRQKLLSAGVAILTGASAVSSPTEIAPGT